MFVYWARRLHQSTGIAAEALETPALTITSSTPSLGGDRARCLQRERKIEKSSGRRPQKRGRKKAGEFRACKRLIGNFLLCSNLPSAPFSPSVPPLQSSIPSFCLFFARHFSGEKTCVCVCLSRKELIKKQTLPWAWETELGSVCLNICSGVWVCPRVCVCSLNSPFSLLSPENKNNSCEKKNTWRKW